MVANTWSTIKDIHGVSRGANTQVYTPQLQGNIKRGRHSSTGGTTAGAVQGSTSDSVTAQQDTGEGAQDAATSQLWAAALGTARSEGSVGEMQAKTQGEV